MNKGKLNPPPELVVTACLSAGLSIVLTLISIVLCILALVFRYECWAGDLETSNGAEFFTTTLIRVYILNEDCSNSLYLESLTKADSVFILVIITLVFAVINFVTAVTLISAVLRKDEVRNLDIVAYLYVGACLASLVVDLTLGVHFGMDYATLRSTLALNSAGLPMNYSIDMIRFVAFLLMTISLKGFVAYLINIVLLIILICYVVEYNKRIHGSEHSIHKLGVLNAYGNPRKVDDPWNPQRNDAFNGYPRGTALHHPPEDHMHEQPGQVKRVEDLWIQQRRAGPHANPAYEEEQPRTPISANSMFDNRNSSKRSDSWLHHGSGPGLGSRPFSYLEEPKRPIPVKSPSIPTNEPQWSRDPWPPAPPVPDPDYSPPPRRLKSALKSNYP